MADDVTPDKTAIVTYTGIDTGSVEGERAKAVQPITPVKKKSITGKAGEWKQTDVSTICTVLLSREPCTSHAKMSTDLTKRGDNGNNQSS